MKSHAIFCSSAIWETVICQTDNSRLFFPNLSLLLAARLNHIYAGTLPCVTPGPLAYIKPRRYDVVYITWINTLMVAGAVT